jgi:hypothetical protein
MKSPDELAARLARQWHDPDVREQRLLHTDSWPLRLTIGKPTGGQVTEQFEQVRRHIEQWRRVTVGTVAWEWVAYRGTAEPIDLPLSWQLATPSEWVEATGNIDIRREYQRLARVVAASDQLFHRLLVRRRQLIRDRVEAEVVKAAELALLLQPGCAEGVPLRALSVAGIDSKFFERHRSLIIPLLDLRFDGAVTELGLAGFLGALDDSDHWLLLADLDGTLLPFSQQRVRDKELIDTPLQCSHVVVVENENCLHQLPRVNGTIAILGAGLNLAWMAAPWLAGKAVAYWGDIDTWGLTMLARARTYRPSLTPLLMSAAVFDQYRKAHAVPEPSPAGTTPPEGLREDEAALYALLLVTEKGRLEQEFLPKADVVNAVTGWAEQS